MPSVPAAPKAPLHDGYRERAGGLPAGIERREPRYRAVAHLLVPPPFEDWPPPLETRIVGTEPSDGDGSGDGEQFERELGTAQCSGW